jgi:cytochrome c551/c552
MASPIKFAARLLALVWTTTTPAAAQIPPQIEAVELHFPAALSPLPIKPVPPIANTKKAVPPFAPDPFLLGVISAETTWSSPEVAAGRTLLHRLGCITCHIAAPAPEMGGDLDGIGDKTSQAWLQDWLADPFDYLPHSRMPRMELPPDEIALITTFLLSLHQSKRLPEPAAAADPYRGSRLFQKHACGGCHAVAGEGGKSGPALDLLGRKTSRQWLYSMLLRLVPPYPDHLFSLKQADAADLTAFMARRFSGGVEMPWHLNTASLDSQQVRQGLGLAITRGCFACHSAGPWQGPSFTLDSLTPSHLEAHKRQRGNMPPIPLGIHQRRAMQHSLETAQSSALTHRLPADFWHLPVPRHPAAPPAYDAQSAVLEPEACGSCHVQQWQEWTASRHARALSPGLLGQVVDLIDENPDFVGACLNCHTPLEEQIAEVKADPVAATGLSARGVTCSGCHLRQWRVFGPASPPKRLVASVWTGGQHGGAVASPDFNASAFCQPCHQDGEMGGFSLQETHLEWAASPQGRRGETCQDCHMPGGDHRFWGIHDRDFVADALDLDIEIERTAPGHLRARIRLHNRGAGHRVPTYATPAIFVKAFLSDADDVVVDSSLETRVVQRRVAFGTNQEIFDTRIPAGGDWIFTYEQDTAAEARFLNVLVEVDPDYFYREFFTRFGGYSRDAEAYIERARDEIADSDYLLFARQVRLD